MAKKSEYGKPTYARAVLAKVGIGDGYGNPKKVGTPFVPPQERMNVANAPAKLGGVINKRKKMLDDL
jgi:hypothetical protein